VLKHKTNTPLVRRHKHARRLPGLLIDSDMAFDVGLEPSDGTQDGGFTAARGAKNDCCS
jgi:hypothetical protein